MASVVGSLRTVSSLLSDGHRSLQDIRFTTCGGFLPEATTGRQLSIACCWTEVAAPVLCDFSSRQLVGGHEHTEKCLALLSQFSEMCK